MRAKKLSRIIGFAIVVAAMGGIGATAWASTDDETPPPAPVVRTSNAPAPAVPAAPGKVSTRDYTWG